MEKSKSYLNVVKLKIALKISEVEKIPLPIQFDITNFMDHNDLANFKS